MRSSDEEFISLNRKGSETESESGHSLINESRKHSNIGIAAKAFGAWAEIVYQHSILVVSGKW